MKGIIQLVLRKAQILILLNTLMTLYLAFNTHHEQILVIEERINNYAAKIRIQSEKNKEVIKFVKNLELSKIKVREVAEQIESVQKQLPNTITDTEILELFSREANAINVKEIFLNPLKEENRGFYFAKQYQFKGMGTFLQFLIFFEKISANDRLLNVRSLSLIKKNGKQKGRFQLLDGIAVMEAFRYNPDYKNEVLDITENKTEKPK